MTTDEIVEAAIQGHASTRDAIRWAMRQEREACKKECMEQFELSLSANEKAKRTRDKEAYLNSAIGAKYCLMRIDTRGEK